MKKIYIFLPQNKYKQLQKRSVSFRTKNQSHSANTIR